MYGYVNIGKLPHLSGYSAFIYTVFLIIFVGTYFRAATQHYENWYSTNISETTVKIPSFPSVFRAQEAPRVIQFGLDISCEYKTTRIDHSHSRDDVH